MYRYFYGAKVREIGSADPIIMSPEQVKLMVCILKKFSSSHFL